MNILLIGFMGTGKTTIGRLLANQLNLPFIDLDVLFEEKVHQSVSNYFDQFGEKQFRRVESQILSEVLTGLPDKNQVIATGGGAIETPGNVERLHHLDQATTRVIDLETSFEEILNRLRLDETRPLLKKEPEALQQLFTDRKPRYESLAQHIVTTNHKSPQMIVAEIQQLLAK